MKISYLPRRLWGWVDRSTDSITSYRLVLYVLLTILGWGVVAALFNFGHIGLKWYRIVFSAAFLVAVCWLLNLAISRFLNIAKNKESELITALILSLILTPAVKFSDYGVLAAAALVAIASKYVITFRWAHIFNPAALGAFSVGLIFHKYAAWWVGTSILLPVVFVGGWLILRKMKRFTLTSVFIAGYLALMLQHSGTGNLSHDWHLIWIALVETQLLFFAYIMLTEPMTSPTTMERYLPYGLVVALLYGSVYWHVGGWQPTFSPEQALIIGNVLAFVIAFSPRMPLKLLRKIDEAQEIKSFVYSRPKDFKFKAGQYMEWTLPANKSDSRGNRRYLTISSSPTEENLMITLRLPEKMSSFKAMLEKDPLGSQMLASRVAGSFTLPNNKEQKLAFLAGGVGVTPFRSMVKYLLDSGEQRDAAIIYAVNSPKEVAFRDVLLEAKKKGIRPHIVVGDPPPHWGGLKGRVDDKIIKAALPDYKERLFYVSGPLPFVNSMVQVLGGLGVPNKNVKTDYFPGYS